MSIFVTAAETGVETMSAEINAAVMPRILFSPKSAAIATRVFSARCRAEQFDVAAQVRDAELRNTAQQVRSISAARGDMPDSRGLA